MRNYNYGRIPEYMQESLCLYVEEGRPTGTFLRLCIINDYHAAAGAGDSINQQHLFDYINFFYNEVPAVCHGSSQAYEAWCKVGGLKGRERKTHG